MGEISITPTILPKVKLIPSQVIHQHGFEQPSSGGGDKNDDDGPSEAREDDMDLYHDSSGEEEELCCDPDEWGEDDPPPGAQPFAKGRPPSRHERRRLKRKQKTAAVHGIHRLPSTKATSTKEEKASGLTLRDIEAARRAFRVIKALAFPSEAVARQIVLRHSTDYHDRPILPIDISRAYSLYGSEIIAAGKTVDRPYSQLITDDSLFEKIRTTPQTLFADLVFVEGYTFLISVSAPMQRTTIDLLPSREFDSIVVGLDAQIKRYEVKKAKVIKVVFDGEAAIQNSDRVAARIGCPVVVLAPNTHVSAVERRIRTLKERARLLIFSLPYKLSRTLFPALLSWIVHRLNGEPTTQRADGATPNEVWNGVKTNIPRECEFHFGEFVTVTAPLSEGEKHTLTPRTERAIILQPDGSGGGWWVLILSSWKKVRRKGNGISGQPIPNEVVDLLNADAEKEAADYKGARKVSGPKRPRLDPGSGEWRFGFSKGEANAQADSAAGELFFTDDELALAGIPTPEASNPPPALKTVETAHGDTSPTRTPQDGGVTTPMASGQADSSRSTVNIEMQDADAGASSPATSQSPGVEHPAASETSTPRNSPATTSRATTNRDPQPFQAPNATMTEEINVNLPAAPREAGPSVDNSFGDAEEHTHRTPEKAPPIPRQTRRAIQRKLGREASVLAGRLVAEAELEARKSERILQEQARQPSRTSSRERKRPADGKWNQVNNLRPDQARAEFGKLETDNAIGDEIVQIVDRQVFAPVYQHLLTAEQRQKVIRTKLFLKAKLNSEGTFMKLKARLVARGDMELKESFDSLYSPTGSLESALAILAIAAFEHRKIKIIDLVGAYLTVDVRDNTETYVKFDLQLTEILVAKFPMYAKFVADDGTFCGRLRKSLYGICQASSNLHRELKKTLVEKMGFKPNPKDPCVFNRMIDGRQTTVIVYVDDILATASNDNDLDAFTKEFKKHHPEVTEKVGTTMDYLGMRLNMSTKGECTIAMQGYTERAAELWDNAHRTACRTHPNVFGGPSFKSYLAPSDQQLFEVTEGSPELPKAQKESFHSIVATMLYISKRSRPDLLCTTAMLATRVMAPTVEDWLKLRRLMSFARSTADRALKLRPSGIYVEAYTDASFGTHPDRKSQSGIVCTIGGAPYYCSSSRQSINAKSAAESEMICISDSGTMIQWGQQFLYYQGYVNLPPARIWEDNQATIHNLNRGNSSGANSRHYEVRYFYIADLARRGIVRVEHLATDEMTADLLTKGVSSDIFARLSRKLMTSQSDVERLGR